MISDISPSAGAAHTRAHGLQTQWSLYFENRPVEINMILSNGPS